MSSFFKDSVFWIEVDKIYPNPFQPRREFDPARLGDLADSIRQYGILQPLVVTRKEQLTEEGGLSVEYELISGERRLRASKLAGLSQVPVLIRGEEETDKMKLEMAIIENLQREDLNPVERARAFERLTKEFKLKPGEIGSKVGKSRQYVANTIRLLMLPQDMLDAISEGQIAEGHARALLMLIDRPEELRTIFKEVMIKRLTVRQVENITRKIAFEKARRLGRAYDPEIIELEERLAEKLGTRVSIENKRVGGKISIDFINSDDLRTILAVLEEGARKALAPASPIISGEAVSSETISESVGVEPTVPDNILPDQTVAASLDDQPPVEKRQDEESDEDLYSVKNFSV
jgi:ParB family chromosome partitioning protein